MSETLTCWVIQALFYSHCCIFLIDKKKHYFKSVVNLRLLRGFLLTNQVLAEVMFFLSIKITGVNKKFYSEEIDDLLKNYEPGDPKHKPDVLKQIVEIEERRKKHNQVNSNSRIILNNNGKDIELNNQQIVELLTNQQKQLQTANNLLNEKMFTITKLEEFHCVDMMQVSAGSQLK